MEVKPPDEFEQKMYEIEASLELIETVHRSQREILKALLRETEDLSTSERQQLGHPINDRIANDAQRRIAAALHALHERHLRQEAALRRAHEREKELIEIATSAMRGEL